MNGALLNPDNFHGRSPFDVKPRKVPWQVLVSARLGLDRAVAKKSETREHARRQSTPGARLTPACEALLLSPLIACAWRGSTRWGGSAWRKRGLEIRWG
jgi:hypothetical protein